MRLVNARSKLSFLLSDKELCDLALIEITIWNPSIIFIITIDLKVHGCKRKQCWLFFFLNFEHWSFSDSMEDSFMILRAFPPQFLAVTRS